MSCTPVKRLSRELRNFRLASFALAVFMLVTATLSSGQTVFTQLVAFNGTDGAGPYYEYLVQGMDGQLYGTTANGETSSFLGTGTVFKVTTSGTLTDMYTLCATGCTDGGLPVGGIVLAPNGNFYGTTTIGGLTTQACDTGIVGCGTVFEITPTGTFTLLHTFTGPDGFLPYANLTLGTDGNLYGTTLYGGNLSAGGCSGIGCGTVFKITPQGKFTSLYSFTNGTDGASPIGRLLLGSNGNFYGTTIGPGTVFEITPAGKLTTLYSFTGGSDGGSPYGGVIQTANGTIYGTTAYGGSNNYGTVYKLVGKKLTTLYNFCSLPNCVDGDAPFGGLIQATDGNLYGTTSNGGAGAGGTVFEITTNGALTTLYAFCSQPGSADGLTPYGDLLQATDGNFYGTTNQGGEAQSTGTVFSISTGLGPFVQPVISSGKVGIKITILGTHLTGATAVSFNGTTATFRVNSSTAITATAPSGATTGPVKVTTPSGTLSTRVAFKVTPQVNSFTPPSGPVGTVVTITGVSLIQATKVTFGGVAATSFTVSSDTQVTATVPARRRGRS